MITQEEIISEIDNLKNVRKILFSDKEKIDKKLTTNYNKISKLEDELTKYQDKTDISWLLFEDGSVRGERYKIREEWARENLPALYLCGYFPSIQQSSLQIKSLDYKEVKKDILKVLPYIKISESDNQDEKEKYLVKRFDIRDQNHSQYGIYHLQIIDETKARLVVTKYGRTSIAKSWDTLDKILKIICETIVYNEKKEFDDDDDSFFNDND